MVEDFYHHSESMCMYLKMWMKLNRLRSFGLNADVHTFVLQLDLANLNALKLLMPKKELSFLFDPLKYFHDQCTCFKQVFMTFDPPPPKKKLHWKLKIFCFWYIYITKEYHKCIYLLVNILFRKKGLEMPIYTISIQKLVLKNLC